MEVRHIVWKQVFPSSAGDLANQNDYIQSRNPAEIINGLKDMMDHARTVQEPVSVFIEVRKSRLTDTIISIPFWI